MACGACGSSSRALARSGPAPTLYQVVLNGGEGRTAFQTHDVALARRVSANYPGSVLVPDPDTPEPAPKKRTKKAATEEASDSTGPAETAPES